LPVRGECFHSSAVNRIRNADAGANGNSTIVLDYGTERLPVADIGQPIVKTTAKKIPICFVDRHRAHISDHVGWECESGTCPDSSHGGMKGEQFKILPVEGRPFALSPTGGFLFAQLFERDKEIVGEISTILPETFSRCSHQVETRGCASIPLIYGHQTSAVIVVVQGFEAQGREFWRAVDEIDHSQRMLNSYSWHNARRMAAPGPERTFQPHRAMSAFR
jgi:hypothetical protein